MVQVDLPGAFVAGHFISILSKKYLQKEADLFTHRLMGPVGWYFALIFSPIGMFLIYGWPAWESMYWWDWVEQPNFNPPVAFFYIFFYLAMVLLGYGSFILGHHLYRQGKDGVVKIVFIISAIVTLAPFILWPRTWYYVGTFAQYHAVERATKTMFEASSFFFSWFTVMSYFAVGSILFFRWINKFANKLSEEIKKD